MPITGPIPLPQTGMEAFLKALNEGSTRNVQSSEAQRQAAEAQKTQQMMPYVGQQAAADLEKTQLANKYYPQVTQADIANKNALAQWYKNRPIAGTNSGSVAEKNEKFFQSLVQKDNPNLKPEQVYEAANVLRNGQNTLSDGTTINPLSPASSGIYNSMLKSQNTAQGLNQQRFAATTEALVKNAEPNARAAFDYSGVLGKGQGSLDKVSQIFGKDSPKYNQYVQFTRVDVPTIAGELMRELGVNATDTQKKMYIDLINPLSWDQNPKAAQERWKHFLKTVKTVGKTISSSPSQINMGLKNPKSNETGESGNSEKVRRKYNIETGKFE